MAFEPPPLAPEGDEGETARINLRLPDHNANAAEGAEPSAETVEVRARTSAGNVMINRG